MLSSRLTIACHLKKINIWIIQIPASFHVYMIVDFGFDVILQKLAKNKTAPYVLNMYLFIFH